VFNRRCRRSCYAIKVIMCHRSCYVTMGLSLATETVVEPPIDHFACNCKLYIICWLFSVNFLHFKVSSTEYKNSICPSASHLYIYDPHVIFANHNVLYYIAFISLLISSHCNALINVFGDLICF